MGRVITEIYRIKKLMNLPILLEQGGVFGILDTFWDNLIKKSVPELTDEEQKLLRGIIDNSPTIKKYGISSIDDVISQSGKETLLKVMRQNSDEISKVIKNFSNEYLSQVSIRLSSNLDSITKKMSLDIVNQLKQIQSKGFDGFTEPQLVYLKNKLIELKKELPLDRAIQDMSDDVISGIDTKIKVRKVNSQEISTKLKSVDTTETTGFVSHEQLDSKWVLDYVSSVNDLQGSSKAVQTIYQKLNGLPDQFDPSRIKLGEWHKYNFTDNLGVQRERTVIEATLPNNQKVLMYMSSGANEDTTGKKVGEWFVLPGFAQNGWYIKTNESVNITKGGNPYMTQFAQYLEKNGFDNLGKPTTSTATKVTPDMLKGVRISNRSFGNGEGINWGEITNAKNIEDYNKIIAQAIQSGDYSKISRAGFENYGIYNFREYLMNNIDRVIDLDPSIGRWSVLFK
jgi:gas vesicle protein